MAVQLSEAIKVDLSYGFLHAEYKDFVDTSVLGIIDFSGNDLTRAPKHTLSVVAHYDREVPSLHGRILLRADARYSSKVFFTPENIDILSQGGYTLLNARMAYENNNGWTIALYGKNLSDEVYLSHGIDLLLFDLATAEIGAPRQYGVSVSYKF